MQAGVDGSWPRVPVTVQEVASVHHRSRLSVTPWKTQCAQSVLPRLDAHPWNVKASTEHGTKRCAGLGACSGQCGAWSDRHVPCRGRWRVSPVRRHPGAVRRISECVSSGSDGTVQGERYCSARGEILRSLQDPRQRRRSARTCSSIKDESLGSEDDQTPS